MRKIELLLVSTLLLASITLAANVQSVAPIGKQVTTSQLTTITPAPSVTPILTGNSLESLINQKRVAAGLIPLIVNPKLAQVAQLRAKALGDSVNVGSLKTLMGNFGIKYMYSVEFAGSMSKRCTFVSGNITCNLVNNTSLVNYWFGGTISNDVLKRNILNPDITEMGIGLYQKDSKMWYVYDAICNVAIYSILVAGDSIESLINQKRVAAGLIPLIVNPKLAQVAQLRAKALADSYNKCSDIIPATYHGNAANCIVCHDIPGYGYPATSMTNFGIKNTVSAENIACSQNCTSNACHYTCYLDNVSNVVNPWFEEVPPNDGHKRNILNPEITEMGVGMYQKNGTMWYVYDAIRPA